MPPQVPSSPRLTLALLALWALLAIYVVWTGDALGYVILALAGLFIFLPALVIWLGTRRSAPREHPGGGEAQPERELTELDGAHGE